MKIALVFGTSTGNTEATAGLIRDKLSVDELALLDVEGVRASQLTDYDVLILGSPTLGEGELQPDWFDLDEEVADTDLSGTKAVFFGLGDQEGYPDTYQDAMGMLHERFSDAGAEVGFGYTETSGHDFEASQAIIDGKFCGLAIDEDNQSELTEQRVENWVAQLRQELSL